MKNAFAIAVAALLLDNAVASPLNVESRQVGSIKTFVLTPSIINNSNRVVAAQAPLHPVHTRQTTPSVGIPSTTRPRALVPKRCPSSSGVTAHAAPTVARTLRFCRTSPATASLPLPRVDPMAEDLPIKTPCAQRSTGSRRPQVRVRMRMSMRARSWPRAFRVVVSRLLTTSGTAESIPLA
jgi:hypothetical protein